MGKFLLDIKKTRWAHDRWCEGYKLEEIADVLFVDSKTLRRSFKRFGFGKPMRPILEYKEE